MSTNTSNQEEEVFTPIEFFSEDIDFSLSHEAKIASWLKAVVEAENGILRQVNYIFCNDQYLHNINVKYLNHDTYTDVITFPYAEAHVEGDIFISIDRIEENAVAFHVPFVQELHRVMVHGLLHLLGYLDKSPEEKTIMTSKEDFYLKMLQEMA